jgi:hypothetical protein
LDGARKLETYRTHQKRGDLAGFGSDLPPVQVGYAHHQNDSRTLTGYMRAEDVVA